MYRVPQKIKPQNVVQLYLQSCCPTSIAFRLNITIFLRNILGCTFCGTQCRRKWTTERYIDIDCVMRLFSMSFCCLYFLHTGLD